MCAPISQLPSNISTMTSRGISRKYSFVLTKPYKQMQFTGLLSQKRFTYTYLNINRENKKSFSD